jgi:hypothetical protein
MINRPSTFSVHRTKLKETWFVHRSIGHRSRACRAHSCMLGTRYKMSTRIIDQKVVQRKWAILMATELDARDASLMLSRQLENLKLGWARIVMYWNWIGLSTPHQGFIHVQSDLHSLHSRGSVWGSLHGQSWVSRSVGFSRRNKTAISYSPPPTVELSL